MIEVLDLGTAVKSELVTRLAKAKNIQLTEAGVLRVSELARGLVDIGFPIPDAFNAALHHKFTTEPSQ